MAADSEVKKTPVDRESQHEDLVVIDFTTKIDVEGIEDKKQENYKLVLGEQIMLKEFETELTNMKKNEEKEFSLTLPDSYPEDVAGKTATFVVLMKEVIQIERPEVNDQLAQKIGYNSLKDFRTRIKEDLITNKTQQAARLLDDKILQAVVDRSKFSPIPECMVSDQVNSILERQMEALNISKEELLKKMDITEEEYKRRYARAALSDVRARLALEEVARREDIAITEEERKGYIEEEAKREKKNYEEFVASADMKAVDTNIKMKRALELLKRLVKVKPVENKTTEPEVIVS